jgi:hypothetical protein
MQSTIRRCFDILNSNSNDARQIVQEAESIVTLSNFIDNPEVLHRLYEELCFQTRGEVALVAAAALAKHVGHPDVQALIMNGFRQNKNVLKMFGQSPQSRILYVICLSNNLDLLDTLNPSDFTDKCSDQFKTNINSLLESSRNGDTSTMSQAIAWLEGLDAACNRGILLFAANQFIEQSTFFAKLAGIEK